MHPYPHHYTVHARAGETGEVQVSSEGLPMLRTAPPLEFDGPGDLWSPETLLCAAVADCFVLSFRAVARASKLDWRSLECRVDGTLDKADGKARFTEIVVHAVLHVPSGTDPGRAGKLLERAEQVCLISNSLLASRRLDPSVIVG